MKYMYSFLLIMLLIGCSSTSQEKVDPKSYLEEKGYEVVSYEGRVYSYILGRRLLLEWPFKMAWAVQSVDPARYFGKTINIEKFIVKNHPLLEGEVEVYVYEVEGQVVGGTSNPHDEQLASGTWSLEGKTMDEIQGKPYPEWEKAWMKKYSD